LCLFSHVAAILRAVSSLASRSQRPAGSSAVIGGVVDLVITIVLDPRRRDVSRAIGRPGAACRVSERGRGN
jgi:hypothetical protein